MFLTHGVGTIGHKEEKINLNLNLIPYSKIKLNLIIDLNVKCETVKLLERKLRENLHDLVLSKDFLALH